MASSTSGRQISRAMSVFRDGTARAAVKGLRHQPLATTSELPRQSRKAVCARRARRKAETATNHLKLASRTISEGCFSPRADNLTRSCALLHARGARSVYCGPPRKSQTMPCVMSISVPAAFSVISTLSSICAAGPAIVPRHRLLQR